LPSASTLVYPEQIAAAQERGRQRGLDKIVAVILSEDRAGAAR
jgi:hypothetical protein